MEPQQLIGVGLVFMAMADVAVALVVIKKLPEERKRIIQPALLLGAALMAMLGVLFLLGVIPMGGSGPDAG